MGEWSESRYLSTMNETGRVDSKEPVIEEIGSEGPAPM